MILSFDELIGKVLLVGLTRVDEKDNVLGHSEYFGIVLKASQTHGIVLKRYGVGDIVSLPPMLENYEKAQPGIYTLKSSGLRVENPDYTTTWRICSTRKQ